VKGDGVVMGSEEAIILPEVCIEKTSMSIVYFI